MSLIKSKSIATIKHISFYKPEQHVGSSSIESELCIVFVNEEFHSKVKNQIDIDIKYQFERGKPNKRIK